MATFIGTPGKDHFVGGAANDIFEFNADYLSSADVLDGGGGVNTLAPIQTQARKPSQAQRSAA